MADRLIFIEGPTAIGKTGISFEIAKLIECEIISCDSMQVYRGMNVGTSKPAKVLLGSLPHHLVDIIDPSEEFSVAQFRALAVKAIEEMIPRKKTPLLVGGSGLYVKVLIDGIFEAPVTDWELRQRLEEEAAEFGIGQLYARLKQADPAGAAGIHPNDLRRIIRALEVFEKANAPISELRKRTSGLGDKYNVRIFGLSMEREALYRKIDERVDQMFSEGLINEARALMATGGISFTASQALGYKELFGHLAGAYDLEEAKRLVKRNTRHFAKRQLTWFRRDKRIEWMELDENFDTGDTARAIWKKLS
ncbi:MAG: tRNA (adenosine(37)-N6)-dimethylallyltransferase MiaA [Candidatus Omnitrophota bacterium]